MQKSQHLELLRRYFLCQWRAAVPLFAAIVILGGVQVALPRLLASFIDRAHGHVRTEMLLPLAVVYLALVLLGQVFEIVEAYLAERIALIATNRLREDLALHIFGLDLSFHSEHRPGELVERIDGDVTNLTNFFSRFLVTLIANGLLLLGAIAIMASIDGTLGAGLMVFSALVLATLYRLRFAARVRWQAAMQAQADQSGFLEEHLSATEDVSSSGATHYAMGRFLDYANELLSRRQAAARVDGAVGSVSGFLFAVGTAAALAFGADRFVHGGMAIGTVFLIFTYTQMLAAPIQAINRQIQDLQTAGAAVRRVQELLDTRPVVADGYRQLGSDGSLGLQLHDVTFGYVPAEPVLRDVSCQVAPGRVLGIVGRTGSGKSTLAKLLLRFHDPDEGRVLVGEMDVKELQLSCLRSRVGLVTQHVQLFQASLRDNLTFFDPSVPDSAIHQVLDQLGLASWLATLPDGLDSMISSGGIGLSAGEAQLVAFARVFLRRPGVVVLDEPTSRLDPATERRVDAAVSRLLAGRTAVVIAHRLQTVQRADDILVLEDGRVVEHGPRDQLAADPGSRFAGLLRIGLGDVVA